VRKLACLLVGALALVLVPVALPAQTPADPARKLSDVEQQLEQERQRQIQAQRDAEQIGGEVEKLRNQLIATARQTQEAEQAVARLEKRQREIEQLIDERTVALGKKRAQMAGLLAALERLALRPPEALLAEPSTPDDTVRAGILLRAILPQLDQAAAALKIEIEDLAALRTEAAQNAKQIRDASTALQREQQNLQAMVNEKSRLESERRSAAQANALQAQKLAAQARDLHELVEKLEAERKRREEAERKRVADQAKTPGGGNVAALPAPGPFKPAGFLKIPFSSTQGKLPLPVRGAVARHFGDPDPQGQPGRGIVIQTRPQAQIIAPHDGQIVYSGSFLGYGQLLIIEHGEGYHLLLAGLSRIDCVVGQWVLAGEPVGVMGNGKDSQQLYIELRRQGVPIDPLSWLVPAKDKVG
jgi:septal ring factor EnvC (AmiA/AmiB activator)